MYPSSDKNCVFEMYGIANQKKQENEFDEALDIFEELIDYCIHNKLVFNETYLWAIYNIGKLNYTIVIEKTDIPSSKEITRRAHKSIKYYSWFRAEFKRLRERSDSRWCDENLITSAFREAQFRVAVLRCYYLNEAYKALPVFATMYELDTTNHLALHWAVVASFLLRPKSAKEYDFYLKELKLKYYKIYKSFIISIEEDERILDLEVSNVV